MFLYRTWRDKLVVGVIESVGPMKYTRVLNFKSAECEALRYLLLFMARPVAC